VRYGECDPQGIVFNANYLLYFDVAFTELWREAVGPWQEMVKRGVDAVVAHAEIDFRAPARYDDILTLTAAVTRLGGTSITTELNVLRGETQLVRGSLRHVCVSAASTADGEGATTCPWPEEIRAGLTPFVQQG
jgi:acyl-CoA thioester hydrolase